MRLTLLLDLLSEDLPVFKAVACQLSVPYLTTMRSELLPSIPFSAELIAQLEALEILCAYEGSAAPAPAPKPAVPDEVFDLDLFASVSP